MKILEITLGRARQSDVVVDVPDDFNLLDAMCNQGVTGIYGTGASSTMVQRTFYISDNDEEVTGNLNFIKTLLDNGQDKVCHLLERVLV